MDKRKLKLKLNRETLHNLRSAEAYRQEDFPINYTCQPGDICNGYTMDCA